MKDLRDTEMIFLILISPLYWLQKFIDWMGDKAIAGIKCCQKNKKRIAGVQ